jgi:hypothetical protein
MFLLSLAKKSQIKKERIKEFFINLLVIIYISLALILELKIDIGFPVSEAVILLVGIIAMFAIILNIERFSLYKVNKVILLMFVLLLFIFFNSIFIRNYLLTGAIFNLFTSTIIAFQLIRNKNSEYLYLLPFWFLTIYILIKLSGDPNPNQVFIRSRNYISFYLIITVIPYYFLNFKNQKSASFIPVFFVLILSIYSLSRSGSASAVILFIAVMLSKGLNKKTLYILLFTFFALVLSTLSYLLANYQEASEISRLFSVLDSLQNGGRSKILRNYIGELDFIGFLYGIDTNIPEILDIGGSYIPGHVHSSILNFISVIGVSFILCLYYLLRTIKLLYKKNTPMLLLLVAILLRSMTEIGILFSYFDYVIWVFILTMFFNYKYNILIKT